MKQLQRILMATTLVLSLATVSFAGTIIGSRTGASGSRSGTIIGSRTGTIIGSRTGTIIGSRTGTIIGSRTGIVSVNDQQQRVATTIQDQLLSNVLGLVLGWTY